jgi:hypothetical protein
MSITALYPLCINSLQVKVYDKIYSFAIYIYIYRGPEDVFSFSNFKPQGIACHKTKGKGNYTYPKEEKEFNLGRTGEGWPKMEWAKS